MTGSLVQTVTVDVLPTEHGALTFENNAGEPVTLLVNEMSGQWVHPTRGFDICGHANSTWNRGFEGPVAGSPVCLNRAGSGTTHLGFGKCQLHGGRGVAQASQGVRLMRDMQARQAVTSLAEPIDIDPIDALLHLVHEAAGNVAFLGARVADLGYSLVGDVYSVARDGSAVPVSEDARGIVKLYNEERDRLAKVSKIAIEAGVEKKQVELLEQQADLLVTVLRAVVQQLGLNEAKRNEALALMAAELRRLSERDVLEGSFSEVESS